MGTSPIPQPQPAAALPPAAAPAVNTNVQDALTYARGMAAEEISSIERLHERTLQYITWFASAFVIFGAVLGFFGWRSLRDAAVSEAQRQMKSRVDTSVGKGLADLNIHKLVEDRVRTESGTYIKAEVVQEIRTGATHKVITDAAERTASEIARGVAGPIAEGVASQKAQDAFADRHLTQDQIKAIGDAIHKPSGWPTRVRIHLRTVEEAVLARDFVKALNLGGLTVADDTDYPTAAVSLLFRGVEIGVMDKDNPPPHTEELRKALEAGGIHAIVVTEGGSQYRGTSVPTVMIGER